MDRKKWTAPPRVFTTESWVGSACQHTSTDRESEHVDRTRESGRPNPPFVRRTGPKNPGTLRA